MTTNFTTRIAALALTLIASATLLLGAVGPATTLGNAIRQGYVSAGEESARQAARLEALRQDMFAAIHTGNTSDVVYQAMLLQTQSLELFSSNDGLSWISRKVLMPTP